MNKVGIQYNRVYNINASFIYCVSHNHLAEGPKGLGGFCFPLSKRENEEISDVVTTCRELRWVGQK